MYNKILPVALSTMEELEVYDLGVPVPLTMKKQGLSGYILSIHVLKIIHYSQIII